VSQKVHIVFTDNFGTCQPVFVQQIGSWNLNSGTPVRFPGRATIPLRSNRGQVVHSHCLPSFSSKKLVYNKEFSALKWLCWL